MLLDEWKRKREGTFTCCDVLVPGKIPNWTVRVLDKRWQKVTSDICFFVLFLPLKLEPNVPLRGWEEGACPTDTDGRKKKKKNLADVSVLTREWKNCPYPCVIVVPFKDVWSDRGDHHKHQLTGRAARSLSVTCVAFEISGAAAASWIISGGKIKTQRQQTWTETL